MSRPARFIWAGVLLACVLALSARPLQRRWRAAELLLALSSEHRSARAGRAALVAEEVTLATTDGAVRARIYRRAGSGADARPGRGLVLAHGVHYRGIDERRLVPFAEELARAGLVVLTPELTDLMDYRITPSGVRVIAASVRHLHERRDLVAPGGIGIMGFSFAGGLSLIAAGEPDVADRVAFVTSVGGHHDLVRVLRFFVSDEVDTPHGRIQQKAHEYGLVVLIYGQLDRFVPEADRAVLHDALKLWLQEKPEEAWAVASRRSTVEGERLFERVANGRLRELRAEIEAVIIETRPALDSVSPRGRLARIAAPVYLLHGSADSVIPASEAAWAEQELGSRDHQALVSPLLDHVEVSKAASLSSQLALVEFMERML